MWEPTGGSPRRTRWQKKHEKPRPMNPDPADRAYADDVIAQMTAHPEVMLTRREDGLELIKVKPQPGQYL